ARLANGACGRTLQFSNTQNAPFGTGRGYLGERWIRACSISKGFSASLLTRQKRRKYKDLPLSRFATAPQSRGAFLSITVGDNQNGCTSGRSLTDVRDDI